MGCHFLLFISIDDVLQIENFGIYLYITSLFLHLFVTSSYAYLFYLGINDCMAFIWTFLCALKAENKFVPQWTCLQCPKDAFFNGHYNFSKKICFPILASVILRWELSSLGQFLPLVMYTGDNHADYINILFYISSWGTMVYGPNMAHHCFGENFY